jgi:hypothetical protein
MSSESSSKKEGKVTVDDKISVYQESHLDQEDGNEIHVMTNEEEDLNAKVRRAGSALEDLITSAIDRAKLVAREKTNELAKAADVGPGAISAAGDSRDISRLGPMVEELARAFEDTMTEIRKQGYGEQERLLIGYRKLLEEQVNVINSQVQFAKRLR